MDPPKNPRQEQQESESFVRKLESKLESGDTVNNPDVGFSNKILQSWVGHKLVNQNPDVGTEIV